jgi:glutathione S-transferase
MVDLADPEARAAFVALWPTAKIPLLHDAERDRVVPETSIMIEYLDWHYPAANRCYQRSDARLDARLWDPAGLLRDDTDAADRGQSTEADAERARSSARRRQSRAWCGHTTACSMRQLVDKPSGWRRLPFRRATALRRPRCFTDASIIAPFHAEHVHLAAYSERLIQRPSVARTLERGGPSFCIGSSIRWRIGASSLSGAPAESKARTIRPWGHYYPTPARCVTRRLELCRQGVGETGSQRRIRSARRAVRREGRAYWPAQGALAIAGVAGRRNPSVAV